MTIRPGREQRPKPATAKNLVAAQRSATAAGLEQARRASFPLHLYSATRQQARAGLEMVVARDASGSFAVLAGHERLVTNLESGVVLLQYGDGRVEYVAAMGGILYFADGQMYIVTQEFETAAGEEELGRKLETEWQAQQAELLELRAQIRRLDHAMLTALTGLGRVAR